jgi:tRNA threonylcarbamoyladenosine biosynthesis protein TsaE
MSNKLINITTNSAKQTQKLGEKFAQEILLSRTSQKTATVLGLSGNLGGGKTTFLQGFARGLGIKEKILSPTFVIMKRFKNFYHIDCYRLKDEKDILELGWKEIISNPKNIVAVEWPEKIQKVLPQNTIFINFKFIDEKTREIRLT